MKNFENNNNQVGPDLTSSLNFSRHLAALMAALLYTMIYIYLYYSNFTRLESHELLYMLFSFWFGNLIFTTLLISGLNKYFHDRSLSAYQLVWATIFALVGIYYLNDMRDLILMFYFAMLSFGFFKFSIRQFIYCTVIAVFGYFFVIIVLSINVPLHLSYNKEILRFFAFSITVVIIAYSGISVSRLRAELDQKNDELESAVTLNKLLATTDDLTGLHTRGHFMDILSQQKAIAEREGNDFVVCFADLDHFKHINDAFGHHTGDVVLEEFANIVRKSIREVDYAARFGGEEFVVLLVNSNIENSINVAERIRKSLEEYNFNDIAPGLNVTVSIGMANYMAYKSLQETLMTADNRMYEAKEKGRNRVISD